MTLTPEQINIEIAILVGYKRISGEGYTLPLDRWHNSRTGDSCLSVPNFSGSLDAMATAEDKLTFIEKQLYISTLERENACMGTIFASVFATALQRAEAFLRVKKPELFQP